MVSFTTVSTTHACTQNVEFSVAKNANFNSGSPVTTTGYVTVWLDLTVLAAGDTLEIRVYKAVGGGTLTADDVATIQTAQIWTRTLGLVQGNWDITVKLTSATGRTIGFEVTVDTNDVNAATIANGAIAAATFASGAITSTVLAANAITSSIIAASAIGASQLASAAITSAKFATDAIDSNALAASAVTKIQSGLALASTALSTVQWTNALAAALAAADLTKLDATVSSRAPQTDTTNIISKLPAALIGGRMSSDVGSWLGTAAAAPTVAGIPKVEDATIQARLTATRAGLLDNLDVASSSLGTSIAAVSSAVTNVQGRLPAALVGGNIPAAVQSIAASAITAAATAGDFLSAVAGQVMGSAIATAKDFAGNPVAVTLTGATRLLLAGMIGKLAGITGLTAGSPVWRDPSDTKDVIRGTVTTTGRSVVLVDPT